MKRSLILGIALSLLGIVGVESVARAYSPPTAHDPVIVKACKGDKDDDCKN